MWWAEEAQARISLAYLRAREDRLYAAWAFMLATGVRRGEVLGLRWAALELDRAQVAIRSTRVMVGYTVQESRPKAQRRRGDGRDAVWLAPVSRAGPERELHPV